jgi:hypothetical protein
VVLREFVRIKTVSMDEGCREGVNWRQMGTRVHAWHDIQSFRKRLKMAEPNGVFGSNNMFPSTVECM